MHQETSSFSGSSFRKSNCSLDRTGLPPVPPHGLNELCHAASSSDPLETVRAQRRERLRASFVPDVGEVRPWLAHSVIRGAGAEFVALLIKQLGGENSWLARLKQYVSALSKKMLDKWY